MSNRNKNILLVLLIIGVLAMTVAFAALTTRLNINGTANVAALKWNIHFDNWQPATQDTVDGHSNTATYPTVEQLTMQDENNVTKVTGINVVLNQPGDYAKYTFEIVNEGTIDAKLDNFTYSMGTDNEVIDYKVDCYPTDAKTDGTAIAKNYVLAKDARVYCDLKVQYKDQTNTNTSGSNQVYEQTRIETSLSAEWTWIQDDSNSSQSGNNEQSSGNTPAPYKYLSTGLEVSSEEQWPTQLDNNWEVYIKKDNSTNKYELCALFPKGTVCIVNGRYSNNVTTDPNTNEYIYSGYLLEKRNEFIEKGATCTDRSNGIRCNGAGGIQCFVSIYNTVNCNDNSYKFCSINQNGEATCDQ